MEAVSRVRLVSRQVDYAVNALCFMAKNGSFVRVPDLRRELDMPPFFIREIMRLLSRAGVLISMRGKSGGFKLAMNPAKISIAMLMEIFNELNTGDNCSFRKKECPRKDDCRLRCELSAVEKVLLLRLRKITIASLIAERASVLGCTDL